MEVGNRHAIIAFILIYVTFFLDNVLLTVLVPIIPDWVRGESLELWARHEVPLVAMLNGTVRGVHAPGDGPDIGSAQATVGLVLSAKAGVQLVTAPLAAAAVCRRGPTAVLRAATALLALAAIVFSWCGGLGADGGGVGVACACVGRGVHGGGAALGSVAGLALCAAAVPRTHSHRAIGALLGAVALGVLVGYPFGGATYSTWSPGAPFLLIAAVLVLDLGAVLLTTSVMAALEPSLPLWLQRRFGAARWQAGAAFIPDSAGYLAAATSAGAAARVLGAEIVALTGQLAVALAALAIPHAASVSWLVVPHVVLGCGLGAADAALVPALLARHPTDAPTVAALLQAASSAAYALGPVAGGLVSWWVGFETALRLLGVLNLLYAALLYRALCRHPLSEQWGACSPAEGASSRECTPLGALPPRVYTALH